MTPLVMSVGTLPLEMGHVINASIAEIRLGVANYIKLLKNLKLFTAVLVGFLGFYVFEFYIQANNANSFLTMTTNFFFAIIGKLQLQKNYNLSVRKKRNHCKTRQINVNSNDNSIQANIVNEKVGEQNHNTRSSHTYDMHINEMIPSDTMHDDIRQDDSMNDTHDISQPSALHYRTEQDLNSNAIKDQDDLSRESSYTSRAEHGFEKQNLELDTITTSSATQNKHIDSMTAAEDILESSKHKMHDYGIQQDSQSITTAKQTKNLSKRFINK